MKQTTVLGAALAALLAAPQTQAFCGFYVSGATGELYNNATQVVLMREGTRTVLSMANNYQGPPENFAMVVPVPVILQKENVKTLPATLFKKIDELAAPRLVEYWEQDPCDPTLGGLGLGGIGFGGSGLGAGIGSGSSKRLGVKIEAQFEVGEYEVVILSAKDSTGLDTWLRQEKYSIPKNAEPVLKPYVQAGMKFFVAKVDINKVRREGDKTMLSPLRFHYDSEKFELPVRLGLLNSSGKQDLLVHVLARGKRYEVANYPNVTIPTNLDVGEITKEQFAAFYAALFDQTLEKNPRAVVTEYAWDASTCDPCPGPTLSLKDLHTLGLDVLASNDTSPRGYVLTRLHARYGKESLGEDLVFKEASPLSGGREVRSEGKLEQGASTQASVNNFQGRYAIRHPWKGPVTCKNPHFGNWGDPPSKQTRKPQAATNTAFAQRGNVNLASFLAQDLPELNLKGRAAPVSPVPLSSASASVSAAPPPPSSPPAPSAAPATSIELSASREASRSCSCSTPGQVSGSSMQWLPLLALGALLRRRPRCCWRRRR
jgi:MYXO-CTERM domain-containing protein